MKALNISTLSIRKVTLMLCRTLFSCLLMALLCGVALAQNRTGQSPIAGADRSSSGSESSIMTGTPEAEMLARREIKAAEKEKRENLQRAQEAAQLSAEINNAFIKNQSLSRTEFKKLERLGKLTRRIREYAGGTDGEVTIENVPHELKSALEKLTEHSEAMRKEVEKTPRQVISTAVIERTNELLEIIRYVRSLTH